MKYPKALIALLTVALMIPVFAQAADIPDEQFKAPRPPVEGVGGYSGVYFDDQRTLFRAFTYIEAWKGFDYATNDAVTCKSALDEPCKSSNYVFYETPMSPCSPARVRDCVVNVAGRTGEATWSDAQLIEQTSSSFSFLGGPYVAKYATPFTGDVARGIPDSGEVSVWKIPGLTHAGGDEFLLIPKINGNFQDVAGTKAANLDVGLFPVSRSSAAGKKADDCFFLATSACFTRWPFPQDASFKVSVKTGAKVIGWFHGRISQPQIDSSKTSDAQTVVTIEGKAMSVPVLATWAKNSELPRELDAMIEKEFQDRGKKFAGIAVFGGDKDDRALQAVSDERNPSFDANYFDRYVLWVQVAKDKAFANTSAWSFRTMNDYAQYEKCIGNTGVAGMVTTNSNAYIAGPPVFKDGDLAYRVASPHFDSKGNLQIGTYDLAIRSDIARCLYGFTNAPIQASLSIIYDDGEAKTATTLISEKNNWLRLSAKGFTYSSPTVKVKLTQAKVSAKKTSITCIKGKTSKKVTAVNPKCPTGYKKK
jgi:hypothetical protein